MPAGSALLPLLGSANRDERRFPNGDAFDVTRPITQHLTFGLGMHFCLGAALARAEGRIALEEILVRFPDWEIDGDNAAMASTTTVRGSGHPPGIHVLRARSLRPDQPWAPTSGRRRADRRRCVAWGGQDIVTNDLSIRAGELPPLPGEQQETCRNELQHL